MNTWLQILKLAHILGFVFMSTPLFNLILVNERAALKAPQAYLPLRYMENIIGRNAKRCYVFQFTVLISGLGLILYTGPGLKLIFTEWVIGLKTLILFLMMGLLSYVHFGIQPKIENLLAEVNSDSVPEEILTKLKPLQGRRKKLASFCLFLVLVAIILGVQVYSHFPISITFILIALSALFTWRAFKSLMSYGWI
ncbi:MAG: hypothetical protein Q8O10_05170 [candidate division Zixibacteria bacterium]|nr:hypothetical protein [candidate division Zixibacteria bacterium]